ncbi:MAG TPA: hypothetical protein VM802_19710 [Chitinophaga sp.]|uniref:hypothetical protein n=1 Tax=Chitinophaga sp. TaxID=1869181 RepID=UPI002BC67DFE|nr:hypothetical protein [Chitinophaga sp.]HVI47113.1 hypothetical protein [Chitinophaga sp.]
MDLLYRILGIALVALGIFINYSINRDRFNRRNQAGIEVFPSYGSNQSAQFAEGCGKTVAILMILAGIILLVASLPQ